MIDLIKSASSSIELDRNFVYTFLYRYVKNIENFERQWNFLSDICQNLISTNYVQIELNLKFYEILPISFCCRAPQNFRHRQTLIHFPKIVKSCSEHPKMH